MVDGIHKGHRSRGIGVLTISQLFGRGKRGDNTITCFRTCMYCMILCMGRGCEAVGRVDATLPRRL